MVGQLTSYFLAERQEKQESSLFVAMGLVTIEIAMLVAGAGLVALLRKRPAFVAVGVGCILQGGANCHEDEVAPSVGRPVSLSDS